MAFCIGATPLKRDEAKRNRVCALETYVRKNEIARVKFSIFRGKRLDLRQCSVIKLSGDMEVRSFFYARK